MLYIFWFLHQTTTTRVICSPRRLLYIFWFLHQTTTLQSSRTSSQRCISFDSYIKPQRPPLPWRLPPRCISFDSYIKPQRRLHCSHHRTSCISFDSYIKPQLHSQSVGIGTGCISFDSYIKPQLITESMWRTIVVYLLIPTSNHNILWNCAKFAQLYIFWFLHQTTTLRI